MSDMGGDYSGSDYGGDYGGGLSGTSGGGLSDGTYGGDPSGGYSGMDFSGDPGMVDTSMFAAFDPTGYGITSSFGADSVGSAGAYSDARGEAQGFGNEGQQDMYGRVRGAINSPLARGLLAALGLVNPVAASFLGMAKAGINMGGPQGSKAAGGHFGGTIGSMIGSATGIPGAGMIGGQLGGQLGAQAGLPGYSGQMAGQPAGAQGGGFMDKALPTLAGLYTGYQNSRGIGKQISSLSGMYGQGSPYAQALRQQLERKDAAAGRRSQYGPREVELQAQLARMASGNAPGLAAMYGQQNANRAAMLKALMFGYDQMGGLKGIQGGLQSLFGTNPMLQGLSGPFDGMSGMSGGGLSTGDFSGDLGGGYDIPSFGG